jgi:GNAT superfamily N-acetyltransferase
MGGMETIKRLADGLVLRWTRAEDGEVMAAFQAKWQSEEGPDQPDKEVQYWTEDLFRGDHPTFQPEYGTLVEDSHTGKIVSAIVLIPQTWNLGGVQFGMGRIELVATHPDYRRRGLIRQQMEWHHTLSRELGHQMQGIVGIPWFYRQFGYEMTMGFGGGRIVYEHQIPKLAESAEELFELRPAERSDSRFLATAYTYAERDNLLYCERDETIFRYDIEGRHPESGVDLAISILVNLEGQPVGYSAHDRTVRDGQFSVHFLGLAEGVPRQAAAPALLRGIWKLGQELAANAGSACSKLSLTIGPEHRLFKQYPARFPEVRRPYSWYIRIPDLAGFMTTLAPVFAQRLARSPFADLDQSITFDFYTQGLKLIFEAGQLKASKPWRPAENAQGMVRFPDLSFLHLVTGSKSFAEVRDFYTDCYTGDNDLAVLLETLFPKQPSGFWGMV